MQFNICIVALLVAAGAAQDLGTVLNRYPSLSKFNHLLRQFNILDKLRSLSHITVLAPTNQAIQRLEDFGFDFNAVDPLVVQALFTYHVLNGAYSNGSLNNVPQFVPTLLRPPMVTNVTGGAVVKAYTDGDAAVFQSGLQMAARSTETDISFTGGLIHTIDSTLIFPHNISVTAAVAGLTSFLNALDAAAMVSTIETLADATVLIPTNEAFESIGCLDDFNSTEHLISTLRQHVIPSRVAYSPYLSTSSVTTLQGTNLSITTSEDGSIFIEDARVVTPDLLIYGGVAHVIDKVLVPGKDAEPKANARKACNTMITAGVQPYRDAQLGVVAARSVIYTFVVRKLELAAISAVFLFAIAASSLVLVRCNDRIAGHLRSLQALRRRRILKIDCETPSDEVKVKCLEAPLEDRGKGKA